MALTYPIPRTGGSSLAPTPYALAGSAGGASPGFLNALPGVLPGIIGGLPGSGTGDTSSGGSVAGRAPTIVDAAPGIIGSQWYQDMLANDPQLQAALSAIAAQLSAYQGQMTVAQQQALEQYGAIPAGLPAQYQNLLSPTVQGIAAANTAGGVSTVAQLQKALHDATLSSNDSLAARGLLHSGAFGQHANENLQGFNTGNYNALQGLLGTLGTDYSNYLGQQDTLNQQSASATSDALTRILNQIQAGTLAAPSIGSGTSTPAPPTTAAPNPQPAPPKAPAPPAMSAPFNPKPPTSIFVGGAGSTVLDPGVKGRAGIGSLGALA